MSSDSAKKFAEKYGLDLDNLEEVYLSIVAIDENFEELKKDLEKVENASKGLSSGTAIALREHETA
jgi:chromosome condensin MukBEF ATPase and DNA-binding subunit MukB